MSRSDGALVAEAAAGDEDAFAELVSRYQAPIKSYLYRLAACREDAQDLAQEVWLAIFTRLATYPEQLSVRTWLFSIATDLAVGHPHVKARWPLEAQEKAKTLVTTDAEVEDFLHRTHWEAPRARYEMREHVDFCFTCILKTLSLDEHIAFMLCTVYDFTPSEAGEVLGCTAADIEDVVQQAQDRLRRIFEQRCGLIRPQGACHLCAEFNNLFNPHQAEPQELAKLELVRAAQEPHPPDLLALRLSLVRSIDPLQAAGTNLHEALMQVVRQASGTPDDT